MQSLGQLLGTLRSRGEARCLREARNWSSYADLMAAVDRWGERVAALGLQRGEVVALRADYSIDAMALMLAAWSRGLVVALVPRGARSDPYLEDAHAAGCFTLARTAGAGWQPRVRSASVPAVLQRLAESGDAGLILFSSGSSGRPKATLHGVERFLHKYQHGGRAFRTLAFLQFDHVAGVDTMLYTLAAGGSLVAIADRNPRTVCEAIESAAVEVLPTTPSFLRLLWASAVVPDYDLSSLEIVTFGSEPMDAATLARVRRSLPGVTVMQKYGTTETGAPRTVSRPDDGRWVQVGGHGVEARVVDGLLWIRGAGTFLGYLNAAGGVTEDGWYCTGDRVEQDGPWIRILGRDSDLINVGGEKVSPAEVEAVILELDVVEAVVVSGSAHPLMGQIVTARIKPRGDAAEATLEQRVRKHCRLRLPSYKVPVTVDVVAALPSSARHKTIRHPA